MPAALRRAFVGTPPRSINKCRTKIRARSVVHGLPHPYPSTYSRNADLIQTPPNSLGGVGEVNEVQTESWGAFRRDLTLTGFCAAKILERWSLAVFTAPELPRWRRRRLP